MLHKRTYPELVPSLPCVSHTCTKSAQGGSKPIGGGGGSNHRWELWGDCMHWALPASDQPVDSHQLGEGGTTICCIVAQSSLVCARSDPDGPAQRLAPLPANTDRRKNRMWAKLPLVKGFTAARESARRPHYPVRDFAQAGSCRTVLAP